MARSNLYPPSVTPGIPKLGKKPEGWRETTFADVLHIVKRKAQVHDDTEYQLVTAKRNREGIVPRSVLKGKDILTKTQFYVREGDFLISRRQIIHGACGVVPANLDGAIVSNEYSTLHTKDGLLMDFLKYYIHTRYFQQTCFQSSVGVDVEKMIFDLGRWLEYKVYLPPLTEQRKIAAVLHTWDEAIRLTQDLIAAKQQRKKGLMQRLLTGQVRFPGFEDRPWRWVRIDEVCRSKSGVGFPREQQGRDDLPILCIKVSDMNLEGNEKYIVNAKNTVDQNIVQELRATVLQAGTVVFPKVGAALLTNKRRLTTKPTTFDNNIMALIPVKIDPEFLYYLSLTLDMARLVQPGALPSVNQSDIGAINIGLPAIKEQQRIAAVLQACDREIKLLHQKLAALQQQKKGLMQHLLTGQIRVRVDE
jgi:type I restriction enzyme S subunit